MTNPLTPLYDAVAWVIMRLHAGLGAIFGDSSGAAWALSIVVLVVLMRLLLVPLFIKQMHATRKMTALAPQVAELKKKHKNDRQKLNEETMKLYKENGANPLAGCLPVVAQLPVFFALFGVLRAIAEDQPKYGLTPAVVHSAQHAQIFGVVTVADRLLTSIFPPVFSSIGTSQKVVILLTVVVSAATTFMTVRQSMKRGMTPQVDPNNPMASSQKMMQYIVPVFALSGLYWQYGLVLYWVTTNLWTLGQQWVLFRRFPPPATATAGASATPATTGGKSGARQAGKGAPAKPAPNVTAAGRAAARQQAAAKAAGAPSAKAGGAQPANGNGAQPTQRPSRPRPRPAGRRSTSCARGRPSPRRASRQPSPRRASRRVAGRPSPPARPPPAREPDPGRTAAAACAGSSRAAPNPRQPRLSPRLRSSGSSRCGSPAAGARANDKAKASHDPRASGRHMSTPNEEGTRW